MNWKVVLNVLLIILLAHFILNNLQYARGRNYGGFEFFETKNRDTEKGVGIDSGAPLLIEEEGEEQVPKPLPESSLGAPTVSAMPPSEAPPSSGSLQAPPQVAQREGFTSGPVISAIQVESGTLDTLGGGPYGDKVKQGNYYTNNWNTPNFQSNVLNLNHFFKRNATPNRVRVVHRDAEPGLPGACFNNGATADQPDIWKYRDELPMNGAPFLDGVFGYSDGNDLFASYSPRALSDKKGNCRDDIRMGMGLPGQKSWRSQ